MAQFANRFTIGGMDTIVEEQWGIDANQIVLPNMSTCTGVIIETNGG